MVLPGSAKADSISGAAAALWVGRVAPWGALVETATAEAELEAGAVSEAGGTGRGASSGAATGAGGAITGGSSGAGEGTGDEGTAEEAVGGSETRAVGRLARLRSAGGTGLGAAAATGAGAAASIGPCPLNSQGNDRSGKAAIIFCTTSRLGLLRPLSTWLIIGRAKPNASAN